MCSHCRVSADCLKFALTHGVEHGMWGGLSPPEREQLTRARPSPFEALLTAGELV
jgi:WhiB family redox-sensing transcriptional regulator